ncbi:MAG: paraquat-inducible protein A [Campylobacterota bacterium]|nr:paraquat-inducible protein A [Campylobacterota bacterium]
MKIKEMILYSLLVVVLLFMILFGIKAYAQAKVYEETTTHIVAEMTPEKLATFQVKALAETFSLGFYENDKKLKLEKLRSLQDVQMKKSQEYTIYFMVLLLLMLCSYLLLSLRAFTFFTSIGVLISLFFGLITPMMMVTIHTEIEYLGDVVLSFESKSLLGSIVKLFENGDVVVATVIVLFSLFIPMVKTVSFIFVSLFMKHDFAHKVVKLFKFIGKWSMVDVFVVATFLVYLTSNNAEVSQAEVEVGLYFFLAYVLVSMLLSLSTDKMLHQAKNAKG